MPSARARVTLMKSYARPAGGLGLLALALALTVPALSQVAAAPAATTQEPAPSTSAAGTATLLEINGAIGPATARYVVHGLEDAQKRGSRLVVLQLDTPGGLDSSMRDIIRAILASSVPVASYVSPPGARAASAGTYILYASHIAAMAPATNLGAATPVAIGGEPQPAPSPVPMPGSAPEKPDNGAAKDNGASRGESGKESKGSKEGKESGKPGSTPANTEPENPPGSAMERKAVNDAVAYIRGLAELRGRNADWAGHAVPGAASLSATAALQQKVIDVIAPDLPSLFAQIDGREVRLENRTVKLDTRGLTVVPHKPDWRTELLAVITNPTVAYGLMVIGIWGLLLEGYNPGAVLPGVVGAICLLIALFAFQILSVNYAGLALVAVGTAMIIAEFFFPTYGSLG